MNQPVNSERSKAYLAILIALLCLATFFEGYDFILVSLIIDLLAKDFHVTKEVVLKGVSVINIGAIFGFFIILFGDRVGRKPIYLAGVLGYGAFSLLTAVTHGFHAYVALQFITKIFLVTEFNIAIIIVSEEFPAKIRGRAIAVLEVTAALGGGMAMLLSKYILPSSYGWRGLYFLGGVPLLLVPLMLFAVKETRHFNEIKSGQIKRQVASFLDIWASPIRKNTILVGALWFLCYLSYAGLLYHWVLFAKTERGWTEAKIGVPMMIATIIGMLGYLVSGALMDSIGRRLTGVIFFTCSAGALVWAFTAAGALVVPSLVAAMFFIFALIPICSTYNAELFPTELRANASAWCNFLMGRPAQVAAPFLVATLSGIAGGIGNAVCLLAIGPLAAAVITALFLPETKGIKMDEIH